MNQYGMQLAKVAALVGALVIVACQSTQSPEETLITAKEGIIENNLEKFRLTLADEALSQYGHQEGLGRLRHHVEGYKLSAGILRADYSEECGQNCTLRYYRPLVRGTPVNSSISVPLLQLTLICRKVAKHQECRIFEIKEILRDV